MATKAHTVAERVLRRFPGHRGYYESLHRKVGVLAESGTAISLVIGHHHVGLLRPFILGEPGSEPYVVCRERRGSLDSPVLCASVDEARSFARLASQASGLSLAGWCAFQGERLHSPFEQLFTQRHDGTVLLRSELEETLITSLAKDRQARVASQTRASAGRVGERRRPSRRRAALVRRASTTPRRLLDRRQLLAVVVVPERLAKELVARLQPNNALR